MKASHLLDANVLIAVTVLEHEHHDAAAEWLGSDRVVALCPVVEGALARYLLRIGERRDAAQDVLDALYGSGRFVFQADDVSYATADMRHVVGHRQVTDAYLATLAVRSGLRLATFDQGLATVRPEIVDLIS